jgi:hypothetical protein
MIKIQKRTEVSEQFIEEMLSAYKRWLLNVKENSPENYATSISRLLPIASKKSPSMREGYEYELTRLRTTEYESLSIFERNGRKYFAGATPHITIVDYRNRKKVMGELGSYSVYIPIEIFDDALMSSIHLIPHRNPNAMNRHPHHFTRSSGYPLDRETGNCYGTYTAVLKGLIDDPDLPELFRQYMRHLRTYGDRPPRKMQQLDFNWTSK